jgi:hypothetical protein
VAAGRGLAPHPAALGDAADQGRLVGWAAARLGLGVQIVRRRLAHGFQVLARSWVVERTLAWSSRHRRTVGDDQRLPDHHAAMVIWALVTVMTRRLARQHHPARTPTPPTPPPHDQVQKQALSRTGLQDGDMGRTAL